MISIDSIITPGDSRAYLITNADGKSWLLPAAGLSIGLELYQPSGIKGRLLKQLLPLLHRMPGVTRAIHASYMRVALRPDIVEAAERVFGIKASSSRFSEAHRQSIRRLQYSFLSDTEYLAIASYQIRMTYVDCLSTSAIYSHDSRPLVPTAYHTVYCAKHSLTARISSYNQQSKLQNLIRLTTGLHCTNRFSNSYQY